MLADPQLAGLGMQRRALRIAMAQRVDPRRGAGTEGGVVGRQAAVAGDADDLAQRLAQVLRRAALLALTQRHEQGLVARKDEA